MKQPRTAGKIFISQLRLLARVGVNPGEQGLEQPITVDVWADADAVERAAESEQLADTVNYVTIARTVRKVVARRHYPLVETLATRIARAVLKIDGVTGVRIRLRKLECLRHADAAGVELELSTDDAERAGGRTSRPLADRDSAGPAALDPSQVGQQEELVIVGGGAAGLAAALWCWRLGHPALLVDPSPRLGGQLHMVHGLMEDLPALPPMPGIDLARRLWRQFAGHEGRWLRARLVRASATDDGLCELMLEDWPPTDPPAERVMRCRATIFATGVRRRHLDVPGERALAGRGILVTAARDAARLAGRRVVVIGGGDSACENALLLARAGADVTLIHRRDHLATQAQYRRQIEQADRISELLNTRVLRFLGSASLEGVEVVDPARGPGEIVPADAALIRVGWLPNSEPLQNRWLDPRGFVRCDAAGHISGEERFFAAGDLLGRISPSVAASFGSGASAARAAAMLVDST